VRIAVVSDIHSNLVALDAVLDRIGSVDALLHLGDVVGYGPEPDAVVERLAALGAVGVRGNHDAAASGAIDTEWFNPDARAAIEWTRQAMSETTRAWLAALPVRRIESGFTLVHGSPRDPMWEYVTSAALARAGLSAITTTHGLHGHTHVPIAFTEVDGRMRTLAPRAGNTVALGEGRMLLNPGSVGQPRDGDPRASYLVIDLESGTATWGRVAYDVERVGTTMRAAGLPARLAERLRVGV
jgi:diadenosine tetraphosphatase ApaH/serine/threonine PP2A family protein phosphatase